MFGNSGGVGVKTLQIEKTRERLVLKLGFLFEDTLVRVPRD